MSTVAILLYGGLMAAGIILLHFYFSEDLKD